MCIRDSHYCGRRFPVPKVCPECGSSYIKNFGIGTEQVEEAVKRFFPAASCGRLDIDALKTRKDLDRILGDFSSGKTDILIGTQLVAKGLDFENVGLVGIIAADTGLNIPDYRSCERTFQLITQAAVSYTHLRLTYSGTSFGSADVIFNYDTSVLKLTSTSDGPQSDRKSVV